MSPAPIAFHSSSSPHYHRGSPSPSTTLASSHPLSLDPAFRDEDTQTLPGTVQLQKLLPQRSLTRGALPLTSPRSPNPSVLALAGPTGALLARAATQGRD